MNHPVFSQHVAMFHHFQVNSPLFTILCVFFPSLHHFPNFSPFGGFRSHGGTPKNHPFWGVILHEINHPAIGATHDRLFLFLTKQRPAWPARSGHRQTGVVADHLRSGGEGDRFNNSTLAFKHRLILNLKAYIWGLYLMIVGGYDGFISPNNWHDRLVMGIVLG